MMSAPEVISMCVRLSGPGLTPEMVERFSLVIPGRVTDVDWAASGAQVVLTCPDGLPPEIVPAMTDIALARGWDLSVSPTVFPHGQTPEIL